MTLRGEEIYDECTRTLIQGHVLRKTNTQNEKDDMSKFNEAKFYTSIARLRLTAEYVVQAQL